MKKDAPRSHFDTNTGYASVVRFEHVQCAAPEGYVQPAEPECEDGHDYEGFPGGCTRMGCSMRANIERRVRAIVAQQLGMEPQELKMSDSVVADLGGDSLDRIEIVMAIEDDFSIEIDDEHAEPCDTLQQMCDHLATRKDLK